MIKKLDIEPTQSVATNHCIINKINEVIDKVNDLTINLDGQARTLIEQQTKISILEEHAHPTAKTPADPYAEQRKWIGKLCWFWDIQEEYKFVGILGEVADNGTYFQKDGIVSYLNCEPVKADDDIIYKGGDNE